MAGTPQDRLELVRSSCRRVADRARYVIICDEKIAVLARRLALEALRPPTLELEHHIVGTPEETAAFFFTLDSINFGSGYFPFLRKRPGMSGYFTIASSLADRFRQSGPLSIDELRSMTATTCASLFGQSLDDGPIHELMELFAHALRDLGDWLERRFGGNPLHAIEAADGSASRFVDRVCEMPMFRDESEYEGSRVAFYKRAQILVSDLALAFGDAPPGRFDDLDRLTIFADNLVPHVLRVEGVLDYADALAGAIDAGAPIVAGSPQEIELRACAVDAVERLVSRLAELGVRVTARNLDVLLWNLGQSPTYKQASPRHRSRSIFY